MIASEVHGCMLVHDYGREGRGRTVVQWILKRQVLDDESGLGFL